MMKGGDICRQTVYSRIFLDEKNHFHEVDENLKKTDHYTQKRAIVIKIENIRIQSLWHNKKRKIYFFLLRKTGVSTLEKKTLESR